MRLNGTWRNGPGAVCITLSYASMEVSPTLQLTTTELETYVRPYAHHCLDARLTSRDVAARFIQKTAYQTAFTFRLLHLTNKQRAKA